MGPGVQPYNYTFSLWPANCKPSILTFKVWESPEFRRHLGNQAGLAQPNLFARPVELHCPRTLPKAGLQEKETKQNTARYSLQVNYLGLLVWAQPAGQRSLQCILQLPPLWVPLRNVVSWRVRM